MPNKRALLYTDLHNAQRQIKCKSLSAPRFFFSSVRSAFSDSVAPGILRSVLPGNAARFKNRKPYE